MRPIGDAFEFIDGWNQLSWLCQWGWVGAILNRFIIPLGSAMIYVFLIPKLTKRATEYTMEQQKGLRDTRKKIEDSALMSVEDGKALNRRYEEMVQEYETRIERHVARISVMKREIEELQGMSVEDADEVIEAESDDSPEMLLTDSQIQLLSTIVGAGRNGVAWESELIKGTSDRKQFDIDTDVLLERQYITQGTGGGGGYYYQGTIRGRRVLDFLTR
jgi:hypothetical protein